MQTICAPGSLPLLLLQTLMVEAKQLLLVEGLWPDGRPLRGWAGFIWCNAVRDGDGPHAGATNPGKAVLVSSSPAWLSCAEVEGAAPGTFGA